MNKNKNVNEVKLNQTIENCNKEEHLKPIPILYKRRIGAYGIENNALMESFKLWLIENKKMTNDSVILGIAWDNPMQTKAEECRYDVCLILSKDEYAKEKEVNLGKSEGMLYGKLNGGMYLVFEILHTPDALASAWQECIPYLLKHNYTIDETRPILERYAKEKVDQHLCELCFPVFPKKQMKE